MRNSNILAGKGGADVYDSTTGFTASNGQYALSFQVNAECVISEVVYAADGTLPSATATDLRYINDSITLYQGIITFPRPVSSITITSGSIIVNKSL